MNLKIKEWKKMGIIFSISMIFVVVTMTLPLGVFPTTGQEAHAEQKGINHKIFLQDGITFSDDIQIEQIVEEIKSVEGINYHVSISDSIEATEILR